MIISGFEFLQAFWVVSDCERLGRSRLWRNTRYRQSIWFRLEADFKHIAKKYPFEFISKFLELLTGTSYIRVATITSELQKIEYDELSTSSSVSSRSTVMRIQKSF